MGKGEDRGECDALGTGGEEIGDQEAADCAGEWLLGVKIGSFWGWFWG